MRLADAFVLVPEFVPGQYEQFQNHLTAEWIEDALAAQGRSTTAASLEEMEQLWQQAKTAARRTG